MIQSAENKKQLLEMWFQRVYDQINLLESRARALSTENPKSNDYDYLINELDRQFENIKIIKKVLNNDVLLQGFNHKLINNLD